MSDFKAYMGTGKISETYRFDTRQHPEKYVPSKGLVDAVNVAIALGQPLLLTGEPGTGKSELAYSVAHNLKLGKPLVFYTKTTSSAKDLFYQYDALGHFHAANTRGDTEIDIKKYIRFEALGIAIIENTRRVVLIDEIDKAPRDFPNDILNEMESLEFRLQETGEEIKADDKNRPVVILTSNSEKNLPDAFLRRCVFYHIKFPDREDLFKIVKSRIDNAFFSDAELQKLIDHFEQIREQVRRKKPATAELLSWIKITRQLIAANELNNVSEFLDNEKDALLTSYAVLVKNQEDLQTLDSTQA